MRIISIMIVLICLRSQLSVRLLRRCMLLNRRISLMVMVMFLLSRILSMCLRSIRRSPYVCHSPD